MIVVEHDAKELLAVQGIPIPGGVLLRQVPKYDETVDEPAGPWLVKPQVPDLEHNRRPDNITASNAREVAEAANKWLGNEFNGHKVSAVRVERKLIAAHRAYLCFNCDPINIGVRVRLGFGGAGDTATPVEPDTSFVTDSTAPEPTAVVACVDRLSDQMPDAVRAQVNAAAGMLTPLFFGYEAIRLQIDPLMIFEDGGWMVGNVELQIDENGLFRHPELISLMDRRGDNYSEIQRRRELGLDFSVVDENGQIGLLTNGAALTVFLMAEFRSRNLSAYNYIDLRPSYIIEKSECLKTAMDQIIAGPNIQTVLINLVGVNSDIEVIAKTLAQTLRQLPLEIPVVVRLAGLEPDAAKKYFDGSNSNITLVSDLETALQLVERHATTQAPS